LDRVHIYTRAAWKEKHSLPVVTERFIVEIIIRAITATKMLMKMTTITTRKTNNSQINLNGGKVTREAKILDWEIPFTRIWNHHNCRFRKHDLTDTLQRRILSSGTAYNPVERQPTFQRNISPPHTRTNNKPSKKAA
jgi:hypothetical protein